MKLIISMKVKIKDDEKVDSLDFKDLQLIQKKDGFCFGMDAVILSNFVDISMKNAIICDLGTGTRSNSNFNKC